MEAVNNRGLEHKYYPAQPEAAEGVKRVAETQKPREAAGRYSDLLKTLQKAFPGAQISVGNLSGVSEIRNYALSHYGSFQIVISPEAMKRMAEDPAFLKKSLDAMFEMKDAQDRKIRRASGKEYLTGRGIILGEDGNVSQWVATQKLAKPQKTGGYSARNEDGSFSTHKTDEGKLVIKKKLMYRPARDLLKIARARNQQMVKSAISGIHAQIYMIKVGQGDKRVKAQLINQANQVVLKARLKIKLLKKEDLMELRQKRLQSAAKIRQAIQMRHMLEEKRQRRKIREYGQIRDYYPSPSEREQRRREELMEWEAEHGSGGIPQAFGCQSYIPVSPSGVEVGLVSGGSSAAGVVIDITV